MSVKRFRKRQIIASFLDFMRQLRRNRVGMAGFLLLLFYLILGLIGPYISPHDPFEMRLAEGYAVPDWFVIFPQFKDYPPNIIHNVTANDWQLVENSGQISIERTNEGLLIKYEKTSELSGKEHVSFTYKFDYRFVPPKTFYLRLRYFATIRDLHSSYLKLRAYLEDTQGKRYLLVDKKIARDEVTMTTPLIVDSRDVALKLRLGVDPFADLAPIIFKEKGEYVLRLDITIIDRDEVEGGYISLALKDLVFGIPGLRYGLLGTDNNGSDLFSQLLYGARISMIVGILASSISVLLGLVVGVIAGYEGGIMDQTLLFITDTLYFMPILPLLIALSVFYGKNIYLQILLIASLSWMAFARTVRSYTLSLRQSLFVEAAKAVGASDIYIIIKHIIPQLIPLVYVQLALSVPGAVLLEASLSFLGLGDPRVPSWGRMLYKAELAGAFPRLIWWWILPPGLMLTVFALSFILFGYALDEIFNPRLRARR